MVDASHSNGHRVAIIAVIFFLHFAQQLLGGESNLSAVPPHSPQIHFNGTSYEAVTVLSHPVLSYKDTAPARRAPGAP